MGRTAKISPMGLFNWDNTLFDLMQIPAQLDRETLINNILAETAELEVLYANPTVFKSLLGVWSATQIDVWNRLYATTQYDYNPIENYNRYETGSDSGSGSTTHSGTDRHTDTTATTGSDTSETDITHGGEDVDTGVRDADHFIAGYNNQATQDSDGLAKRSKDSESAENRHDYGETVNTEGTITYGKTETRNGSLTHGESIVTENDGEHELHAHGNIGVTTTQKLIREQREVDKFNLYDIITNEFKMRFCVLVY